jgi:coenzyme PQQ precursor peptide PqqA
MDMTSWETPSFVEIDMSAEIGGYQGDYGDRPNGPDPLPDYATPAQTESRNG